MNIWRLNIGVRRTSERTRFVLASWAYVTGYWRWHISFRRHPRIQEQRRIGFAGMPGHWGAWVVLPLLGTLSIQTQPPMESMKRYPTP